MTAIPTGQWSQNTQIGLPQGITDLANSLDSIITLMVDVLNTSRQILDIARTFVIGTLDPAITILEQIINEIEGYINDIREIGLYIAGDFDLKWPFDSLRGGYTAYESRMVARLTDTNDPSRPDFSSSESAVGIFLYASADPSAILTLVNLVAKIARFFGKKDIQPKTFTSPVPLEVTYGNTDSLLGTWGTLTEIMEQGVTPSLATLKWRMAPAANAGTIYFPQPPPAGFLIEISTCKEGLQVAYDTPITNATDDALGNQQRQFGLITDVDQRPFVLYGGRAVLQEDQGLRWSKNGNVYTPRSIDPQDGTNKPGGLRTYAYQSSADNVPIPLEALYDNGKYILQRAFFYDTSKLPIGQFVPGQPFAFRIRYEDMPYEATFEDAGNGAVRVHVADTPARNVYVRVRAVTDNVMKLADTALVSSFAWSINQDNVIRGQQQGIVSMTTTMDPSNVGATSISFPVTFPSATAEGVLNNMTTALALLVLSRSDLTPSTVYGKDVGGQETGWESLSYLFPFIFGDTNPQAYFKKEGVTPTQFRKFVLQKCQAFASDILSKNSHMSEQILQTVLDSTQVVVGGYRKALSDLKWSDLNESAPDITILQSLATNTDIGTNTSYGVAVNPLSVGILTPAVINARISPPYASTLIGIELLRRPGFLMPRDSDVGFCGLGSADYSPVVYNHNQTPFFMSFCRNMVLGNDTVTQAVLNALAPWTGYLRNTSNGGVGDWQSLRLVAQGMPEIEGFLDQLTGFLGNVRSGVQSVTDISTQYIEFVEARILELEAMLERIDALIQYLASFDVPACDGLIVVGNGTDGILQGFIGAQDKPFDSKDAYGAGAVIVAGGLPTAVLDILLLFFQQGS